MNDKPEQKMEFDYSEANSIFSDVITINVSQDTIVLGFGQREIGSERKAKVITKVYMTIPHFMQTLAICQNVVKHLKDSNIIVEQEEATPDAKS